MATTTHFLTGIIEGFYGKPWTQTERFELFDWMASWGLNTYFYAPKDDLKHRVLWRERYSPSEANDLKRLIRVCKKRKLRFIYALSPGLDIRYSHKAELDHLQRRFEQMLLLGCEDFALLFDDIPDRLDSEDIRRWGSLASAQCHVANAMFGWIRHRQPAARFLFCPTSYCGRMAQQKLGGEGYLSTVGRELLQEIDVFWTGPEIISRQITVAHIRELQSLLRRKPLIWDNLHANDYDGRRFYCGPYAGRPLELRNEVSGLLSNPNSEFPLNYVPLRTLGEFVRCPATVGWDARKAYLSAMREWLPRFATARHPVAFEDFILFGDCHYLPHEEGPEAEKLYERVRDLLAGGAAALNQQRSAFRKQASRLRELCVRLTELRDRSLFYALSRRIWELREELDLLEQYVESKPAGERLIPSLTSHLPGTYRGGMVARLQRLLVQHPDGKFAPARSPAERSTKTSAKPAASRP